MKPTLYIIRGLPGSGKSTLADKIVANLLADELGRYQAIKVEADQFFVSSNGHVETYNFDRRFLGAAHDECYGRAIRYLRSGYSVAVANTFTTKREVERYINGLGRTGLSRDVDVKVILCTGRFKSPHGVPARAVEKMRERWEPVEGEITFNGEF